MSVDRVRSPVKRCSQVGVHAVNNSPEPPLSIRRPTLNFFLYALDPIIILSINANLNIVHRVFLVQKADALDVARENETTNSYLRQ